MERFIQIYKSFQRHQVERRKKRNTNDELYKIDPMSQILNRLAFYCPLESLQTSVFGCNWHNLVTSGFATHNPWNPKYNINVQKA